MIPDRMGGDVIDLRPGQVLARDVDHHEDLVEPIALFDHVRDPELDRIIDAARAVLGRNGWDCLKVERVLVQARLSTRSFYRHFANKNELLAVMLADDTRFLTDWLDTVVVDLGDPVEQLATWVRELVTVGSSPASANHSRFFVSRWWELRHEFPDLARGSEQRIVDSLTKIIERGVATGSFSSDDPEFDARLIQGVVTSRLADLVCSEGTASSFEVEAVIAFALRSLGSVCSRYGDEVLELR